MPGKVTLEEALQKIRDMARDTLFVAEEEQEAVPKDDLGDAITRSMEDGGSK